LPAETMKHDRLIHRVGLILATVTVLLWGCDGSNPMEPSSNAICDASPGTGRPVLAWLQRPFNGNFPMTGYFDHDLPITFDQSADTNGYVLTFCGARTGG